MVAPQLPEESEISTRRQSLWLPVKEWVLTHKMWLLVGILFSSWFVLSGVVYHFESGAKGANITSYGDSLWWGIVTFLTVGYGDRYPVTVAGRLAAGVLMLCGVTTVGLMTAKISSIFLEQALIKRRAGVDPHRLKNHFVVCGWKEKMPELLKHILDFNPNLKADQLILIANIDESAQDEIHADPRLKDIGIIAQNYFEETALRRAMPERARKVLILADRTLQPNGQIASQSECDARTIMTAMTLSHIARGTLVAAEILDPKMDQYLKLASVTEIIYSREYSRLLLANASGGTGVSNIIFDLLDPRTSTVITTHAIEEAFIQKTYGDLKKQLERDNRVVLIGILENTGNQHNIKEQAVRKAQKTADMSVLLSNLQAVKQIRCNFPVFNPESNYPIAEGSMAIVIESRFQKGAELAGTSAA